MTEETKAFLALFYCILLLLPAICVAVLVLK